jgi:hypothetical protein
LCGRRIVDTGIRGYIMEQYIASALENMENEPSVMEKTFTI